MTYNNFYANFRQIFFKQKHKKGEENMDLKTVKKTDDAVVREINLKVNLLKNGDLELIKTCSQCKGTGLIRLPRNKKVGAFCPKCHGNGQKIIRFKPWTGLQEMEGIETVQNTFLALIPKDGKECFRQMPYSLHLSGTNFSDYVKQKRER